MADAAPPPLLITRWATQAGRDPPALSPARAVLDARGFPALLAEAAHLAGLVGFRETDVLTRGDWRRMLAGDPTMVMALLATADIDARSEGLQALLGHARDSASAEEAARLLRQLIAGLLRFAAELDGWLAPAEEGAGMEGDAAHRLIATAIEQVLAPQLRALLIDIAAAEAAGLFSDVLPHTSALRLRHHWRLATIADEARAIERAWEDAWIHRLLDQLAEVADSFVREVREIGARAAAAIGPSLDSGAHTPHVALVMAFAQVFHHAQDRLNAVPQRLADFYHADVLRAAPRGATPDGVLLAIVPRPAARPAIPRGTVFPAGKDAAGAPIGFAADAALSATGATLAEVRCWTPAAGADGSVTRIDAAVFPGGADGATGDALAGIAAAAAAGVAVAPAAVIVAPALAVVAATRRIVLTLSCAGLGDAVTPAALAASLSVAISTAAGWRDLGAAGVTLDWTRAESAIALAVTLAAAVPPIAPCPAGTADAPAAPALRLSLRQEASDATAQPWALFGGVTLRGATLDLAVEELGGLTVSANGQAASATAAAPFGIPQAQLGGTLRIDHPAFAAGPLDRLLLTLDWASLPPDPQGFGGYYHEYVVGSDRVVRDRSPFTNAAFTVAMTAPVPGWGAARAMPLFATTGAAAPPDIAAAGAFAPAPPPAPFAPLAPVSWFAAGAQGDGPAAARVELTLTGPADGFGDAIHPANIAHAMKLIAAADTPPPPPGLLARLGTAIGALFARIWAAIGAALGAAKKALRAIVLLPMKLIRMLDGSDAPPVDPDPPALPPALPPAVETALLPNPPYRPLLSRIRIDFARQVDAADGGLVLHHAPPFEPLGEAVPLAGAPLFAPLPAQPTIDIALGGARAGERQALLVRLGTAGAGAGAGIGTPAAYAYRAAHGWAALPAAGLSDGSEGLQATGILGFAFPGDAAPIGAADALWLRVTLPGGAIPPVIAITPDALSATRVLGGDVTALPPIPPGTITKLPGLPGVARIVQPLASIGGRAAEDPAALRRRLAERVRHRARGTTAWDIERLVLDAFPAIAGVRVLPGADPAWHSPAGETTVIVVPAAGGGGDIADAARPRATAPLRGAIATRLAAAASPFARIAVVDPVYLAVDVGARLIVRGEPGDAIRAALAAQLSPLADPGFDLDDDADEEALRAAVARFLLRRPDVAAIDHLAVTLRDAAPAAPWRVPVAGEIDILALAAQQAALPW